MCRRIPVLKLPASVNNASKLIQALMKMIDRFRKDVCAHALVMGQYTDTHAHTWMHISQQIDRRFNSMETRSFTMYTPANILAINSTQH